VVLKEGTATSLAAPIQIDCPLIISKHRRIPIETDTDALFHARIAEGGACRQVEGSTIPPSWRDAAEAVRRSRGLVVILGEVDAGKSTLCTFLANTCLHFEIGTSVIDGDVGQADIGPPATTSSSTVSRHIFNIQELKPERSYFIGDTSPSLVPDKLVKSIVNLKDKLSPRNGITILNTDGWIGDDEAVAHKLQLLDSLQPDLVLGLNIDHELDRILEQPKYQTIRLKASSFARTRTREERKKARVEGYRRFFQNPKQLDLKLSTVKLRTFNAPRQQRLDQGPSYRGALAGLLDENDELLSIGRVVQIENGIVRITTMTEQTPRIVELGAVILSSRFEEVGYEP
jgi:polynucleotide 5'-hydroxyl-kinase GRC3/NOL9